MRSRFFTTIVSGETVSGEIAVAAFRDIGVFAPTVTSGQCFLQVAGTATTPVSADYVRLRNHDFAVNSEAVWSVGAGGAAAMFPVGPFAYARLQMSVAQTDTRTFTVVGNV